MNFSPGFSPWQDGEVGMIYFQALLCFADLALQVFYISFPTGLFFFPAQKQWSYIGSPLIQPYQQVPGSFKVGDYVTPESRVFTF